MESVYESILARNLARSGLKAVRQKVVRFEYDGMSFDEGFRIDILVEDSVVLELKSTEKIAPVHKKQLLTYLRLSKLSVGLILNFGSASMKEGIQRVVNQFDEGVRIP